MWRCLLVTVSLASYAKYAPRAIAFLAGPRFKNFVDTVNLHPQLEGTVLQTKLDAPLGRIGEYNMLLKNLLSETFEYGVFLCVYKVARFRAFSCVIIRQAKFSLSLLRTSLLWRRLNTVNLRFL